MRKFELQVGDLFELAAHSLDDRGFVREARRQTHVQLRGVLFFVGGSSAGLATATYEGEDRGDAFKRADLSFDGGDM